MPRPLKFGLLAAGVVLFVLISAALARVLSATDAERGVINAIVLAEARGDVAGILRHTTGCAGRPACATRARVNAAALKRPGRPKLLQLNPDSRFVLHDLRATTRVAWTVPGNGRRPVVQCFYVHRTGNVLSGLGVEITGVSKRIAGDARCKGQKESL